MVIYPSDLRRQMEYALPRHEGAGAPVVRVTPRDHAHRKCAVWGADHYEVQAFYTTTDPGSLDLLEQALRELPGVYLTTQVRGSHSRNEVTNPEWPAVLGTARRGLHELRPQVLALIDVHGAEAPVKSSQRNLTTTQQPAEQEGFDTRA